MGRIHRAAGVPSAGVGRDRRLGMGVRLSDRRLNREPHLVDHGDDIDLGDARGQRRVVDDGRVCSGGRDRRRGVLRDGEEASVVWRRRQ